MRDNTKTQRHTQFIMNIRLGWAAAATVGIFYHLSRQIERLIASVPQIAACCYMRVCYWSLANVIRCHHGNGSIII